METIKYLKSKLGYGVGAVGLDLSYGMFYSFLAMYLTNVLHLEEGFLLLLTPIARLWDGINDPMMGTIVDNTRTKMGKYRPWILRGSMLNAIVLVFLFWNVFDLQGLALKAYISIMYIGWGMSNTLADIPYWSMVPSFTSDPKERNLISTLARAFSGIGQGIISIGAPILMAAVSKTYDVKGEKVFDANSFRVAGIVCAVCLVLFSTVSVLTTKERISTKAPEKFSFGKALKIIKTNDQLIVFMVFAMISNAGWYLTSGVAAYYFDVVVGDAEKQSLFSTFQAVGSVVGMLVLPMLTNYFSKRRAYQISLVLAALGYVGIAIGAFSGMLMVMNVAYLICAIGMSSMFIAQTIFLADVVDYGEVKMGFRAESITFSMKGFLQKMAYTLQTIILFASLGISHYDGDKHTENPEGAKLAITLMLSVIPAVLFVISLIIFSTKFKLHGSFMDEVTAIVTANREKREELAEKEENKEAAIRDIEASSDGE